ncbi:hypothetical protein [Sphingomonas daechungensis]|uniref:hypothetical protein n=1 Tax=Sphingomonas daechungensis TaxID=1176646 RepID=UPI003783BB77
MSTAVDQFTDDKVSTATMMIRTPQTLAQISISCAKPAGSVGTLAGRKITYSLVFAKPDGSPLNLVDDILGRSEFKVRLDDSEVLSFDRAHRHSNELLSTSGDIEQSVKDTLRWRAEQLAARKIGTDKYVQASKAPNLSILFASAGRLRLVVPTMTGDVVLDLNQADPGPTSVLRQCGLIRESMQRAISLWVPAQIEAWQRRAREIAKAADDELKYNPGQWPSDPTTDEVRGSCLIEAEGQKASAPCGIRRSAHRIVITALAPATFDQDLRAELRIDGSKAWGTLQVGGIANVRSGDLTRAGDCWVSDVTKVCATAR